jgi:Zn-dependent peptidase ImmA (M78 family)/transcriptional regulator with XRE-family HTH domain
MAFSWEERIMAIDLMTLGKRLRKAREDRGVTQEAAAEALGIPRTAVVQMEAGNRSISTLELAQVAEIYERPIAEFFSEGTLSAAPEDDPILALHRVTDSFKDHPNVQRQVARCVEICREGADLEHLLGKKARSGPPFYGLPEPRNAMEAVRQGSGVAAEERNRLGLGDAPIHALADFLSNQGVWAASVDLPDGMSGLFLRHSPIGMVILVNRDHARPRKRFSYAHEYAHALLDRNRIAIVSTRENSKDRSETRANAFAAALLMPEGGVRSYLASLDKGLPSRQTQLVYDLADDGGVEASGRSAPGSQTIGYQDVASLARYFGASYQAAAFRLQALNIVNQPEREFLIEQEEFGNRYLRMLKFQQAIDSPEAAEHQEDGQRKELVRQVAYLAIEAFRREEISKGKLLELSKKLDIPGKELLALAQGAL